MREYVVSVIVVALLSIVVMANKCSLKIGDAQFYANGKLHATDIDGTHVSGKLLRAMVESNFGLHKHDDAILARLHPSLLTSNIFSRPKANILAIVDESTTDCERAPRAIRKLTKLFQKRFNYAFIVSAVHSDNVEKATVPVRSILKHGGKVRLVTFDSKNNVFLLDGKVISQVAPQSADDSPVFAEVEAFKSLVEKLYATKSEAEKKNAAPDFYIFTFSSLKSIAQQHGRDSANFKIARELILSSISTLIEKLSLLYQASQTIGEVLFVEDKPALEHNRVTGRRLHSISEVAETGSFTVYTDYGLNITNGTTTDLASDISDYQTQVWAWIVLVVCILVGFYIMSSIDYSRDTLIYQTDVSKEY